MLLEKEFNVPRRNVANSGEKKQLVNMAIILTPFKKVTLATFPQDHHHQ